MASGLMKTENFWYKMQGMLRIVGNSDVQQQETNRNSALGQNAIIIGSNRLAVDWQKSLHEVSILN